MKYTVVLVLVVCAASLAYASSPFVSMPMKHTRLHPEHHLYGHFANRRLEQQDGAQVSYWDFEMGGNIYPVGIYWVAVDIGTPGQSLLVAVDSGSSDLLVPSSTCQGCHEQNTGAFNTTLSSTLSTIACNNQTVQCPRSCTTQCSFTNTYETCNLTAPQQPCTVTGYLYSDIYAQGGLTASVVFGLIETQTANFQQFFVIDGVIGFAFPAGSSWGGQPPIDRLVQTGECDDIFAMCMLPDAGGVLTIGGLDPNLYTGPIVYIPLVTFEGEYILYTLPMTDIQIDTVSIGLAAVEYVIHGTLGGCVLDSGTNTILFPTPIYTPWQKTFVDYFDCASSSTPPGVCDGSIFNQGTCFQYSQSQIDSFPQIQLVFGDVTLEVDGPDYIVNNGTASWYCLGILNTGPRGNLIVGDVLMQNYYVIFDRQNHQIGWAAPQIDNCIGSDQPIVY